MDKAKKFIFDQFDKDGDGKMTKEEFIKFMYELGREETRQDQFNDCFKIVNLSKNDNFVTFEDFSKGMTELYACEFMPLETRLKPEIEPESSPHYYLALELEKETMGADDDDEDRDAGVTVVKQNNGGKLGGFKNAFSGMSVTTLFRKTSTLIKRSSASSVNSAHSKKTSSNADLTAQSSVSSVRKQSASIDNLKISTDGKQSSGPKSPTSPSGELQSRTSFTLFKRKSVIKENIAEDKEEGMTRAVSKSHDILTTSARKLNDPHNNKSDTNVASNGNVKFLLKEEEDADDSDGIEPLGSSDEEDETSNKTGSKTKKEKVRLTMFDALEGSSSSRRVNFTKDILVKEKISEGGTATIHVATAKTEKAQKRLEVNADTKFVVKVLREPPGVDKSRMRAAFEQEASMMWLLGQQSNFIRLLGYSIEPMVFVMKYYELGSLYDALHQSNDLLPEKKYTPEFILQFSKDIISAVSKMHSRGIVHGDLKTANILLEKTESSKLIPVLIDFGLSTVVENPVLGVKSFGTSQAKGASPAYAAPELLRRVKKRDGQKEEEELSNDAKKSVDVYSFGICVHELIKRGAPWGTMKGKEVEAAVLEGKRPEFPEDVKEKIAQNKMLKFLASTMEICWHANPNARPTASALQMAFSVY